MSLVARTAVAAELEQLISLLDRQFIFDKQRTVSLAQRFPAVYSPGNAGNVFLFEESGEILSSLVCKQFTWSCDGNSSCGAMIGAVWTHPQRRGENLASRLLTYAAETWRGRGADFAVLWTDQPSFYARLGWIVADRGVLGELEYHEHAVTSRGEVTRIPARAGDIGRIETIRKRWCNCLTPRRIDDYRQLPVPATAVELLTWDAGGDRAACALVGDDGTSGIVYELVGHPDGFPALWSEVCRGKRRVLVNDVNGSASYRWLVPNTGLVWQQKPLAMWLPLSDRVEMAKVAHWYIPYFDRI